jgi:CPA1 family monovalent cation:H+ antiporter
VTVLLLATAGVVQAACLFGAGIWVIFRMVGHELPLAWCLLLGAILGPTDPVAVAEVLERVRLPAKLKAVMAGESLFNDGAGVVLFSVLLSAASKGGEALPIPEIAMEFLREAGGALALGSATGWVALELMRRIDDYTLEIMISLALALGTYSLADVLGFSAPIAVVVAGLLIGGRGTETAMSEQTRKNLTLFWTIIDGLLNALLFLLLGLEAIQLSFAPGIMLAGLLSIPLALAVRAVSVVTPVYWLHARNPKVWPSAAVLIWSGLRGGISVALALSLPSNAETESLLVVCYMVVLFTIVVQGLTIERVIRRAFPAPRTQEEASPPRSGEGVA